MPGSVADILALWVGFASALMPVMNIEAYLGARGSAGGVQSIGLLGLVAALGQMVGKLIWYYLGAHALSWGRSGDASRSPTPRPASTSGALAPLSDPS